jgi:hypothetical protein
MADYNAGLRHGLSVVSVMDERGNMVCDGPACGLGRLAARDVVVDILKVFERLWGDFSQLCRGRALFVTSNRTLWCETAACDTR